MDITSKYLAADLIDQVAAGAFPGKAYAFVKVRHCGALILGVAVANESGYHPFKHTFKDEAEAKDWVDGLNAHIGRTPEEVDRIVISTMGGRPYYPYKAA